MSFEQDLLINGALELGLSLSDNQVAQLLAFLGLMQKWNKAYNLSGIRDSVGMVQLHLLDSLAVLPHLKPGRTLDVGTGAGLPGIPLAIVMPNSQFVLLDSNAKKTRFVQHALLELRLNNSTVVQTRVEDYHPEQRFDTIITRAFASLADIQNQTQHLLASNGELIAMKGQPTLQELNTITADYAVTDIKVPGIDAMRCLITIKTNQHKDAEWEK